MRAHPQTTLDLPGPDATAALGRALAARLGAGDALLLSGPVGAGKTHLARALIREAQRAAGGPIEEVPSPTYTLVQTYDAGGLEIWHVDLYRLTGTTDAAELGLEEAFDAALCLVEWPDRLGGAAPPDALRLELTDAGGGRRARLAGPAALLDGLS